ncbi:ribonuclease H-like domain-containing protein [Favolaschia claudopus]|uniref:ribonuclease H n=1 Tax=Favolaschia claudopus TaxID=2862362 RepID=A0AAW0AHV2_9AGAR
MEYGLVVWYQPVRARDDGRRKGSVGVAKRLERVQRTAVRLITGAFRTTATDIMEYHAFVAPVVLRLNRTAHFNALRLASLPPSHPLHKPVRWCATHYVQRHRSPLHELFNAFPQAYEVESIITTPTRLVWTPQFTWSIAESKEDAAKDAGKWGDDTLVIYSDGSGYEGGIGAAATTVWRGVRSTRRVYLGPDSEHTVFEAEVAGTLLALDLARSASRARKVVILLDNQACIRALANRRPQPGMYLLTEFHRLLTALLKAKPRFHGNVHLAWVPGHSNVEGNELADEAAKQAAQGAGDSNPVQGCRLVWTDLPVSLAAQRATATKRMAKQWETLWKQSRRAMKLASIDRSPPSRRILRLYGELTRTEASILTQLRTGHVGLNAFLHRIKVTDSPLCLRCKQPETVSHYLLTCRRFLTARHTLRQSLKPSTSFNLSSLLSNHKNIRHTLQYIKTTVRFPFYLTSQ